MNTTHTKTTFGKILLYSLIAGAASAVINVILFFIGKAMGAFPDTLLIPDQNQPFTVIPFVISSLLPSLVAGILMGIINHFSKNPKKIFNIIAIVLVLLSFYTPFTIPTITLMTIILFNVMHLVVALSLMFFYKKIIK